MLRLVLMLLTLPAPDELLARMRVRQAELQSLSASLEQTKSYPQLGIEDPPERGRLYVDRRGRTAKVRIEIATPEPRILTMKDGRYVLYQPRIRQAVEGKVTNSGRTGLFTGVMTGSASALEELERSYAGESLGKAALADRLVLRLRFTARPGAEVHCQQIELFVDETLLLPIRQTCQETNQSVITFSLSDVETNVPLEGKLFEAEIPAGVERVKG